jgi:N-acetyl-gamma-glutamyl-phosphate reductase
MSLRVAIIGPTSYTGLNLIRLLLRHPEANVTYLASQRELLPKISEEFPELRDRCDMMCQPIDPKAIAKLADVAFLCLPHVVSMKYVPSLIKAGLRVIDLSADYRLKDAELYEWTYGTAHEDVDNLDEAVYGIPEFLADQISDARLVANPGCYPTAAVLGIAPLIMADLVKPAPIIVNAASGASGAGRTVKQQMQFAEVNENYCAYSPGTHRHQPEIDQALSWIGGQSTDVLFVPHLLPIDRGILATIYLDPVEDAPSERDFLAAFRHAYTDHPFIRVSADLPNIKHVRDTNYCDITVRVTGPAESQKVVVFSAIDNMIKGASGQAIQNMNVMFEIEQTMGLV